MSLLPVYHRGYDAVIPLLPLAWTSKQFTSGRRLRPTIAATLPSVISIPRAQRFAPIDPTNYAAKALWGPAIAWSVLLCTAAVAHQQQDQAAQRSLA